jgi:hypothetical protein
MSIEIPPEFLAAIEGEACYQNSQDGKPHYSTDSESQQVNHNQLMLSVTSIAISLKRIADRLDDLTSGAANLNVDIGNR